MGSRSRRNKKYIQKQQKDQDLREVKYILLACFIVFTGYFVVAPALSAPAMPLQFIQYADAAEYVINVQPDSYQVDVTDTSTATSCPDPSGPAVGFKITGTQELAYDPSTAPGGCKYSIMEMSEASTTAPTLPKFLEQFLKVSGGMRQYQVIETAAETNSATSCRLFHVSSLSGWSEYNYTFQYDAIDNIRDPASGSSSWIRCSDTNAQRPEVSIRGSTDYLEALQLNRTVLQWGLGATSTIPRETTSTSINWVNNPGIFFGFVLDVPANNTEPFWFVQEHPKFDDNPGLSDSFIGIDGTTFTMDTGVVGLSDRGQIVAFKEFNKTQDSVNGSAIKITGGFEALTASDDMWLRFEIKDGSYGTGATGRDTLPINTFDEGFAPNEYDAYQSGGSLGVIHLEPDTIGTIKDFDIELIPNWINSEEDIVTVFIGLDDNSTSGSLVANITSFEISDSIAHDFDDINDLRFWQSHAGDEATGTLGFTSPMHRALDNDYDVGYLNVTEIGTSSFTGEDPPTPEAPTGLKANPSHPDQIDLTWNHPITNVTGFVIYRDGQVIAETINPSKLFFNDTEQLDFTDAAFNRLDLSVGLEPDTSYTYEVCAINGGIEETTCTGNVTATTAPSTDVWYVRETDHTFANGNGGVMDVLTTGGPTSDWLRLTTTTGAEGGDTALLFKSFPIGAVNQSEVEIYMQAPAPTLGLFNQFKMTICDGDINRFGNRDGTTSIWNNSFTFSDQVNCEAYDPYPISASIDAISDPIFFRMMPNWNEIDSGFATIFFYIFDDTNTASYTLDIKNVTITNFTSYDFTGAAVNYTSDVTNCDTIFGVDRMPDICDSGSVETTSSAHLELKATPGSNDWQYITHGESEDSTSIAGFENVTVTSSEGIIVEFFDAPDDNDPREESGVSIFKVFNASDIDGQDFSIGWESPSAFAGTTFDNFVSVYDGVIDRWNSTQWESTEPPNQFYTELDTFALPTPSFSSRIDSFTMDLTGSTSPLVTVLLFLSDDSLSAIGEFEINNMTVGGFEYDFKGVNVTNTIEVPDRNPGERGLIGPHSTSTATIPPAPAVVDATAFGPNNLVNWTSVASSPPVDQYWIERSFDLNGTWQFREIFPGSGGGSTICTFSGSIGANDVYQMVSGGSTNYGACQTWINLPTELINNTNVYIDWEGDIAGFQTGTYTIKTGYANQAVFGNPFTSLPVFDSSDIVIGTQGQPTLDSVAANNVIGSPVTASIIPTTGFPRTISTYSPSAAEYAADTSNPYTALVVQVEDDIGDGGTPQLRIFSINVTDSTTDETKMFWNFTETNNAGLDNNIVFNYDYGTFDVDLSNTESDDATIFNTFENIANVSAAEDAVGKSIDEVFGTADFYDNFTSNKGWEFGNESFFFLDTDKGLMNFTKQRASGTAYGSINIANQMAEDIDPDTWSYRTKLVFETANTPANPAYTKIFSLGTDEYCDSFSVGEDCLALTVTSSLKDWQLGASNETHAFINANLHLNADVTVGEEYFAQIVKDNGVYTTTIYTDETFTTKKLGVDLLPVEASVPINLILDPLEDLDYLILGEGDAIAVQDPNHAGYYEFVAFWNGINITEGIPTRYVDDSIQRNTEYRYKVFAENSIGNGTKTESNSVLTNDVPTVVTGLSATRTIPTQINLQWDELADDSGVGNPSTGVNLTKYQIFRSENGGPFTLLAENLRQSPPAIFFNDTTVNELFFYSYNVAACNELGCGNATSNFFVGTPSPQPTNLEATADIADVLLEWDANQLRGWDVTTMDTGNVLNFSGHANSTIQSEGFFFREDGKKMYIVVNDPVADFIDEFTLSTAFDPSTATWEYSLDVSSENDETEDIHFKPDGTIMATVSVTLDELNYYTLLTPWDLSTATHTGTETLSGDQIHRGLWVRDDGLMFWTTGTFSERLIQHNMTTAWDFSTTITDVQKITISADTINPNTVEWRDDGFVLLILQQSAPQQIDRYNLTTAWDISTATYHSTFDLENELGDETETEGLHVAPDGVTIFTLGNDLDEIKKWTLSSEVVIDDFRIERGDSGWAVDELAFVQSQNVTEGFDGITVEDVEISSDGKKMYIADRDGPSPSIVEYDLTTPWDISTAEFNQDFFTNVAAGGTEISPYAIRIVNDGTKMYYTGQGDDDIKEFTLSTPYDISTATLINEEDISSESVTTRGLYVSPDGTKIITTERIGVNLHEYTMSTPYDVSTLSLDNTVSISGDSPGNLEAIYARSDGLKLWTFGEAAPEKINEYNMTSPFDITTLQFVQQYEVDVSVETIGSGLFVREDGLKAVIAGRGGAGEVHEYNLNATNFEIIVPSLNTIYNQILFDDFTTYPDNATGDLVWPDTSGGSCTGGTGGTNNFCGVNATSDTLVYKGSSSDNGRIIYDVFENHGINVTDSNGNGNFSVTWKHLEDDLGKLSAMNYLVSLTDTDDRAGATGQACINARFIGSQAPTDTQITLIMEDNSVCNSGFEDIDSSVEDGDDDIGQFRYGNLTKAGDDVTFEYFTCEEMTLACRISSLSANTGDVYDNLRYLRISGLNSGSSSTDYRFDFDDISLSINGELVTTYRDKDVDLGTTYAYRVTALNNTIPSAPSEAATVLTNNVPINVTGVTAQFSGPSQINIQWDEVPDQSGIGSPSTGLNLTKYQVFRENVTAATPFELAAEVFRSSPPNNFYNDTEAVFPFVFNYQITACNAVGCGFNSTSTAVSVTDPPGPVENFNGTVGSGILATADLTDVVLDWPDALFAVNYTVTRAENNVTHVIIAQGVPTSEYIDTDVPINTNFTYGAWGVNDNGNGTTGYSNPVITNDIPTAPQNLTGAMGIVIPDLEDVFLDWEQELDNGTGNPSSGVPIINYTIERKQGVGAFSFLANVSGGIFEYEDESVIAGANYTWHVKGVNAVGESPFSNTFSIITTPLMPPNEPTLLTANTLSGTEIQLTWMANATGDPPTEYVIQQRHVGFTGFGTIATVPAPTLTYTATGLLAGNTYDYRVRADNGAGSSAYSNILQNVTFTVPSAPLNLIANTVNDTTISLDWDEPASTNGVIVKYEIERESPTGGGFTKIAEVASTVEIPEISGTRYKAETVNLSGVSCPTVNSAGPTTGSPIEMRLSRSVDALDCQRMGVEFDISTVPNDAVITNVTVTYNNQFVFTGTRTCDWRSLEIQPSTLPASSAGTQAFWDDIGNGTLFISAETDCQTTGTNKTFSVPGFITDLQDSIDEGEDWWGIGHKFTSETRDGSVHRSELTNMRLTIEYANATISADTSYTDNEPLASKTEYNYRVNATNTIGSGPYSNQAAITTFGVPDAPINLAFDTNGVSEITVEWDAPLNDYGSAITGYRIDQAQDVGGTFVTVIADTGNNVEPLEETFVGLLQETNYIYRIAAINGFGLGPFSANLTAGTFTGPSEVENLFIVFNATKPYSTFLSWETPLNDGGKPIAGFLVERKDTGGMFQQIANITSPTILNYTDASLLNLALHEYRVAAYSNPVGSFTEESVVTFVPANIVNFTINEFEIVGDVLQQNYSFVVDDCFPSCTLSQADIERNGLVEANIALSEPVPLDTTIEFTTWFVLPTAATSSINTTAIVSNLGGSGDDEAGVVLATAEFLVEETLFFNHTRTTDFEFTNFTLIRHPVPWDATCTTRENSFSVKQTISLQGVGYYDDQLDATPSLNLYVQCEDPVGTQILAFTSFGTGNGTLALTAFTDQLGGFMGVPVPWIFIIILAAIWTGRSASTGIIFLAVAIGSMGILGYFDPLTGSPTEGSLEAFWGLIVFMTLLGVFIGKRFF